MKLHTEKCIASNAATHLSRHIGAKTEDAFLPNEKCTYNGYNIQICRNCIIAYRFSFFNTFPKNVIPDPSSPFDPFPFQNHSPTQKPPRTSTFAAVCEMFRIAAPAAHHIFPLMDPLPPLAEQLLGAEINKIPHTLVCGILCFRYTIDEHVTAADFCNLFFQLVFTRNLIGRFNQICHDLIELRGVF